MLIVPETGTKRGWIRKLENKFEHTSDYIFRVFTSKTAGLKYQLSKLPSSFRMVIFLNDPLESYGKILGEISKHKNNLSCFGLHLFKHRKRISLNHNEISQWSKVINSRLNGGK